MSFLVEDHDDVATLEEALAFIDSLEVESSASSSDSDMNIPPPHSRTVQDSEAAKLKIKKRKRTNLSSSTRLHQRKKAEVLYLRRRAQELEDSIENLKAKMGNSLATINPSMGNNWMKVAETHFQARLRSEETNRSLRAIMASQMQVSDTLRGFIEKQVSFQVRQLFNLYLLRLFYNF
ncbi:hypothetical protein PHMEG_00021268 [Phytophthora megakarya]|uniref:BZIP domain-containing protein n=1 Tax=Phytophthora megakarya TaxID=4795 RepID=A0A225VM21_9STRA|nr:hypothetical protein PHMEG_00021268 [Phytophthora megakarya]